MSYTDTDIGITSDWDNGDDGWDVLHNASLNSIRAALRHEVAGVSNNVAVPVDGDFYIVGSAGSGDFLGQNNKLAMYASGAWVFSSPALHTVKYIRETKEFVVWTGTAWYADKSQGSRILPVGVTGDVALSASVSHNFITDGATGNVALTLNAFLDGVTATVGLQDETILDGALTASSYFAAAHTEPWDARLHNTEHWSAAVNDVNQWWKIDLGSIRSVVSMAMQGTDPTAPAPAQWITSFDIEYSDDDSAWTPYNSGEVLNGNVDRDTVLDIDLLTFNARYIRINPVTWDSHISARFEFYAKVTSDADLLSDMVYIFKQDSTGGRVLTFPASVEWLEGVTPIADTAANAETMFRFITRDRGVTWFGIVVGDVSREFVLTAANVIAAPATATSAGAQGNMAFDATNIYVCISTDVWVKATLATW